jgi:hypothetical protein
MQLFGKQLPTVRNPDTPVSSFQAKSFKNFNHEPHAGKSIVWFVINFFSCGATGFFEQARINQTVNRRGDETD